MRGARLASLLPLVLLACDGPGRRIDEANTARHAGHPREALEGYRAALAELGDGPLSRRAAGERLRALQHAADVSYLELGDFTQALSYYRRIVALYPGTPAAWRARATTGDIYRERLGDRVAAIAQWTELAASDAPEAPRYALAVAREYLELHDFGQARTEARLLRERFPGSPLADEAQLLTAQAWSLEKRPDEAQRAYQALIERRPPPEVAARAREGQAGLAAEAGKLERAAALYREALAGHPSPDSIRTALARVEERRARARTGAPGDRASAFDHRSEEGHGP